MIKKRIFLLAQALIFAAIQTTTAQSAGFSVSAGANYSLLQAPNAVVKIPFSELLDTKFKVYDVLSESNFSFSARPGGFLSGGVQWNLSRGVLIGTGITLQYSSYDLRPGLEGYRPVPEGSDTLYFPLTVTQPPCDEVIMPDGFSGETNPDFRNEMVHLLIPLDIRLRPGKGRAEIAAGAWAALPAWSRISKERVFVDRRYLPGPGTTTLVHCEFSKGMDRETSADGLSNLVWGVRGELAYRFTPAVGMFAAYSLTLSNLYDVDSKPPVFSGSINGIEARQQLLQLGLRLQWEPERPEVEDDPFKKLNKATHKEFFLKKKKQKARMIRRKR